MARIGDFGTVKRVGECTEQSDARVHSAPRPLAHHRLGRSRGQSMVEMALTLPFLLLLMLGTIDIGRVFIDYIQIRNGVFEGARYGSTQPSDTTGITNAVLNHGVPSDTIVNVSCSNNGSNINCNTIPIGGEGTITVVASRTYVPFTTSFLKKFFGIGVFKLKESATMQVMT